jgi:hypothetical protein
MKNNFFINREILMIVSIVNKVFPDFFFDRFPSILYPVSKVYGKIFPFIL